MAHKGIVGLLNCYYNNYISFCEDFLGCKFKQYQKLYIRFLLFKYKNNNREGGCTSMNLDRKVKRQQQRIKKLTQQIDELKQENEILNKEIESLYKINDIRNSELAEVRMASDKVTQNFNDTVRELKEVRDNYRTLSILMSQTKKHYEQAMQNLLGELQNGS